MVESGLDASNDLRVLKIALLHLSLYVERRELSKSSLVAMKATFQTNELIQLIKSPCQRRTTLWLDN